MARWTCPTCQPKRPARYAPPCPFCCGFRHTPAPPASQALPGVGNNPTNVQRTGVR